MSVMTRIIHPPRPPGSSTATGAIAVIWLVKVLSGNARAFTTTVCPGRMSAISFSETMALVLRLFNGLPRDECGRKQSLHALTIAAGKCQALLGFFYRRLELGVFGGPKPTGVLEHLLAVALPHLRAVPLHACQIQL